MTDLKPRRPRLRTDGAHGCPLPVECPRLGHVHHGGDQAGELVNHGASARLRGIHGLKFVRLDPRCVDVGRG